MSLSARLKDRRVVIAGDVMLDRFLFGRVDRISPEAPVPVLRFEREERRLGGAANVAANVRALGGHPVLAGVVGADEWGALLRADLDAAGIESALVTDASRPTTCKVRLATSRNQQVARVDYESDDEIGPAERDALLHACTSAFTGGGALVISDYLKGTITAPLYEALVAAARGASIPVIADPKTPDPARYRGATVVTPNHHEAEAMSRMRIRTDDDARAAAAREVSDVTGAGDTVVAALALGLAGGLSLLDAADLANRAAAVVVGKFGAATATFAEIEK